MLNIVILGLLREECTLENLKLEGNWRMVRYLPHKRTIFPPFLPCLIFLLLLNDEYEWQCFNCWGTGSVVVAVALLPFLVLLILLTIIALLALLVLLLLLPVVTVVAVVAVVVLFLNIIISGTIGLIF